MAKYATKTADGTAWLAHPIRSAAQLERLGLRPHVGALVRDGLGPRAPKELAHLRLRAHAHTLGYRGQFSSKSMRFSTTFGALRAARAAFARGDGEDDFDYDGEWRYAGRGYVVRSPPSWPRASPRRPRWSPPCPRRFPDFGPSAMSWENGCKEISAGTIRGTIWEGSGNPVWRDGAMTTPPTPLDHRDGARGASWPLLARLASSAVSLETSSTPSRRSRRRGVLCLCRSGPLRRRGRQLSLLGVLAPELASMRRHLVRHGAEDDDAEAVRSRSPGRSSRAGADRTARVAPEPGRRHLEARCARRPGCGGASSRPCPCPTTSTSAEPEVDRLERWPGLLAAAVAAGVLTPRQVVDRGPDPHGGASARRGGQALGRPYGAVRKERQRAEEALRAFALSYDWGESS